MSKDGQSTDEIKKDTLDSSSVLAKAFRRACLFLEITDDELMTLANINLPNSDLKQLSIFPNSELGTKALLIIDIAQKIKSITGGDKLWVNKFMRTYNSALGDKPINKLSSIKELNLLNL